MHEIIVAIVPAEWLTSDDNGARRRNEIRGRVTHNHQRTFLHIHTQKVNTMSKASADIPVIDISPSNPEAAKQVLAAAENNGFLFIENNAAAGMPPAKVDEMFDLVRKISMTVLKRRR